MKQDVHVRVLAGLMGLLSLPLLLMLVLSPLATIRVLVFDFDKIPSDERVIFFIVMPLTFVLGLYGVGLAIVARGLWRGKEWAGLWGTMCARPGFPSA